MRGRPDAAPRADDDGDMPWVPLVQEPAGRRRREIQVLLERDFPDVSSDEIWHLVEAAWARTDGATVHQFRTILAERRCREALRSRPASNRSVDRE